MVSRILEKLTGDPLDKLRGQLADSERTLTAVEDQVGADALAGKSPDTTALMAARARVASVRNALAAAERTRETRAAADVEQATKRDLALRRSRADAAMKSREKAAAAIEEHCQALAKALKQLTTSSVEMADTRLASDLDGTMLAPNRCDMAFRCFMAKAMRAEFGNAEDIRFGWICRGVPPYVIDELPPLTERIKGANAYFATLKVPA